MKTDCIKDGLELLQYLRSSKNIRESKQIIDTICGNAKEIKEYQIPKEE